jgi:dihydropteroate synthase
MNRRPHFRWRLPSRMLALGERTLVMGVLNVTPDSFSDGGDYLRPQSAVKRALAMEAAGADILDIGGESTRPGAESVSAEEELQRVVPVLRLLQGRLKIAISIDTSKEVVADAAAQAGAEILNDVTALRGDLAIAEIARRRKMGVVLMHMRGAPRTMQQGNFARDVMKDIASGLRQALKRAEKSGIPKAQIVLDPGIGFGKSHKQNYELLGRLGELARLGCPLLAGTSRKSFLGRTLGNAPAERRIWGTAATVTAAILNGAHIVRVHDVEEMVQIARVADEVLSANQVLKLKGE